MSKAKEARDYIEENARVWSLKRVEYCVTMFWNGFEASAEFRQAVSTLGEGAAIKLHRSAYLEFCMKTWNESDLCDCRACTLRAIEEARGEEAGPVQHTLCHCYRCTLARIDLSVAKAVEAKDFERVEDLMETLHWVINMSAAIAERGDPEHCLLMDRIRKEI